MCRPLVGSVNDGILTPPNFLLMNMDNMLHPYPLSLSTSIVRYSVMVMP